MVRATIFASALFAFAATVTAVPRGSLVNVDGGKHIGTGDLNFHRALRHVVNADNLHAHEIGYDINAVGHDDDDDHHYHHHHGIVHGLVKRGPAPDQTVRIARKNRGGRGNNKKGSSKKGGANKATDAQMA